MSSRSVLIVDSFTYLIYDLDLETFKRSFTELRKSVKELGSTLILVSHRNLERTDKGSIAAYLSDSVVSFEVQEGDEFIRRYMRVHRWHDKVLEQFIYYKMEQGRMDIDLRARVV